MTGLRESGSAERVGFLGVWEDVWCARARLAWQAERYRAWLREQGCSRDQAAEIAARLLLGGMSDTPPSPPHHPKTPLIH